MGITAVPFSGLTIYGTVTDSRQSFELDCDVPLVTGIWTARSLYRGSKVEFTLFWEDGAPLNCEKITVRLASNSFYVIGAEEGSVTVTKTFTGGQLPAAGAVVVSQEVYYRQNPMTFTATLSVYAEKNTPIVNNLSPSEYEFFQWVLNILNSIYSMAD